MPTGAPCPSRLSDVTLLDRGSSLLLDLGGSFWGGGPLLEVHSAPRSILTNVNDLEHQMEPSKIVS